MAILIGLPFEKKNTIGCHMRHAFSVLGQCAVEVHGVLFIHIKILVSEGEDKCYILWSDVPEGAPHDCKGIEVAIVRSDVALEYNQGQIDRAIHNIALAPA